MRYEANDINQNIDNINNNGSNLSNNFQELHNYDDLHEESCQKNFDENGNILYVSKTIKKKSKIDYTKYIKTAFLVVATMVVTGAVSINTINISSIEALFDQIVVGDNKIYCSFFTDEEIDDLTLVISNSFFEEEMQIEKEYGENQFGEERTIYYYFAYAYGLLNNMNYKIAIKQNNVSLNTMEVRTLKSDDEPMLEKIVYYSNNIVDGKFYFTFTVNYAAKKAWYWYGAYLVDTNGNYANCYPCYPDEEMSIDITLNDLTTDEATLYIYCSSMFGEEQSVSVYEKTVSIK